MNNIVNNLINRLITFFNRKHKINSVIEESIEKNEKALEKLGDEADYDGMGNYGRFPPLKKWKLLF